MKRVLKIILSVMLLLAVPALCIAAESVDYEALDAAETLNKLGLFSGTGVNEDGTPIYSLDRVPTRAEAVVMLVKLLGKEEQARAKNWKTPFTDVEDWAKPYVGYAYSKGYTAGTGKTTFGSKDSVTAQMYLTFVLKALGYEEGTDFIWNEASLFSDSLGITSGEYQTAGTFTRGDVAKISVRVLQAKICGGDESLIAFLEDWGVITRAEYSNFLYEVSLNYFSSKPQYKADGSFSFSGSGAGSIRHVDIPAGQYYCVCENETNDVFRADLYYGDGENDYWMIGSLWSDGSYYAPLYEKYFRFDMAGKELTDTHIDINAKGPWTITFKPFTEMDFNGKISGRGNYVSGLFTADADNYIVHATHTGSTIFKVYAVKYDPRDGQDFYRKIILDYGSKEYKELITLEKGCQYYYAIVADGDWTIELGHNSIPARTTKIDTARHVYTGQGNELITGISLPEGQWYAECTYAASEKGVRKSFDGKLFFDVENKKYWPIAGSSSGSGSAFLNKTTLFDIKGKTLTDGILQVNCNGKWTITFKKVELTTDTAFSGKGATVTKAFLAPAEKVKIRVDYEGSDEYYIRLMEYETSSTSTRAWVVCSSTGSGSLTKEFSLVPGKHYYFSIEGEGAWSLVVSE